MANAKITDLTAASAAAKSMLIEVTQDPAGTPATRKLSITQLFDLDDGTKTTSAPILNLAQTWNAGGVTFTAMKINVTDTASAETSLLFDFQTGGVSQLSLTKAGVLNCLGRVVANNGTIGAWAGGLTLGSAQPFGWSSTTGYTGTLDLILVRDAANALAQRNGTTAQVFRVYNTFTNSSNYESAYIGWNSNIFYVSPEALGTGSARAMVLGGAGASTISFAINTVRWQVNASGHFVCPTDNTYDIGASGATRPRNVYVGNDIFAATAGYVRWASRSTMRATSDGNIQLANNAINDFDRLQFGGSTSSFPAIKRVSAGLKFVLADDSASAAVEALSYKSGAPNTGTAAAWKFGSLVTAAVTPDTTRYIELDVAGTLYKVIVST